MERKKTLDYLQSVWLLENMAEKLKEENYWTCICKLWAYWRENIPKNAKEHQYLRCDPEQAQLQEYLISLKNYL